MIMRRIFLDFILGLISSIGGFLMFIGIYNFLEILRIDLHFGGDKGKVFWGLFFGLTIGSISGILLAEKLIYKEKGWNIWGILLAIFLSLIGNYISVIILDKIGGGFVFFVPLFIVMVSLIGYHIGFLCK
jgi:hypothetical protein